jgi:hypothetical protein
MIKKLGITLISRSNCQYEAYRLEAIDKVLPD